MAVEMVITCCPFFFFNAVLSCVAGLSSCVLRVSGGSAYRHRRKQKKKKVRTKESSFFFFSALLNVKCPSISVIIVIIDCFFFFFSFPCTCLYDAARDTLASSFSCLRRVGFRNKTVVALEQNCTAKKKKKQQQQKQLSREEERREETKAPTAFYF